MGEGRRALPNRRPVKGRVRNLTNYGAFIEIEEGIDGLLHVSDMSWTRKISHPSEVVEKGQEIECKVLSVDQDRRRIALGLKQMDDDPWATDIPNRYQQGQLVSGKVTKITNFGVFVGLEDGLEGLLHISELSEQKVENPQEVVNVGDEIEVKILRVDSEERKIGLSRKRVEWAEEDEAAAAAAEAAEAAGEAASRWVPPTLRVVLAQTADRCSSRLLLLLKKRLPRKKLLFPPSPAKMLQQKQTLRNRQSRKKPRKPKANS